MQRQHYVIALLIGWIYLATVTAIDGDCWQGVNCGTCGGWQGSINGVPVCCAYCEKSGMALRPTSCNCLHNGDDKPEITGNPFVIDNEQLELKCNSTWGRSFTSYKWFRNGMVINGAKNEIYQQTINFETGGYSDYFCQVSNGILTKTSDSVPVLAFYLGKPKVVGKTEVEMYGNFILYCESNGIPPIKSYKWFRNGKTFGNVNTTNGPSVRLIVDTIYAASWFSCEVSNKVFKKLSDPVPVTVLFPSTPANLSATHLYKAGKLYIDWSEPVSTNGDVRKYELCHKLLNGDEGMNTNEHCQELDGKVNVMTIIGLGPFSAYQITVQAFYEEGLSQKAAINASTYEGVPWNVQNLSVNESTSTSFEVEWDPPENIFGIFQGFTVEYSLANSESLEVGCQNTFQRRCKIDGLKPYTEYDVQVTVRNQAFKNTTVETFTTRTAVPSNVQNLRVNKSTSTSFELEWDPPENIFGILQGYTVEYSLANSESFEVGCQNTLQRSCKIDGLKPYTEYDVRVTVRNQAFKNTTVEMFRTRTAVNLALIIGGSVGIVVFIILCFVAFYWFYFRTRTRKDRDMKNEEQEEEEGLEIYGEGSMIYNELPEEGSEIYAELPELSVDDHEKPAHHDPDDKPPPLPPRDRNSSTMTSSIKDRGQEPVTAQDETSNSDVYVYRTPIDDNDILPNAKINPHKDKKLNSESDVYFYRTPIDENDILPKAKINPDNSIDFQQNEDVSINTPED